MRQRLRERERSGAKGAASDRVPEQKTKTPMERFRSMARRLVNVPRAELDEQRRKESARPAKRRKARADDEL